VVQVWRLAALPGSAAERALVEVLAPEEAAQSARFVPAGARAQYVCAHGLLRLLLGAYLRTEPKSIRFTVGRWGKPSVAGAGRSGPEFNIAHSGGEVLLAFAEHAVGIDVERHRRLSEAVDIAERFFSPAEAQAIRALGAPAREIGFFRLWTRKEAVVKAAGLSVAAASREAVVLGLDAAHGVVELADADPDTPSSVCWTDLVLAGGYSAAVGSVGGPAGLRLLSLDGAALRPGALRGLT